MQLLNRYEAARIVCKDLKGNSYNHASFASTVNALAIWLSKIPEEQIIVCENNSVDLMILYFAVIFANKTVIPLDPEKKEDEIEQIKSIHSRAAFFKTDEIKKTIKGLDDSTVSRLNWEDVDFNRVYLITYTSGSTGQPKGVMHNLFSLFSTAYEFGTLMEYNNQTIMGHCMPMTYMAGILNTILLPYLMGGTIVVLPRFSAMNSFAFWKNVVEEDINTLWLSPTMLRLANLTDNRGEMKTYFHKCGMKISIGTAPLDFKLREEFENKYEIRLYQSYGLSETLLLTTEVLQEEKSKHTVGRLLPSAKIELSTSGELLIDVPWMFVGYTNVDTSEFMSDGVYKSGDLGKFVDGNLIITGRCKETIVKGGYNINPRDIETIILDNSNCSECAVMSLPMHGEEMIFAVVVADEPMRLKDINSIVIASLGKHYRIDYLRNVKALPKNLNGKIDRIKIKRDITEEYGAKN